MPADEDTLTPRIEALEKQYAALQQSAPHWPDEMTALSKRMAELLAKTETAQRKADDEALRAYNAKQACEEHAKFTTATRGQVEVELAAIQSTKTKCEETERALSASRSSGDEATKAITTSREALLSAQAWVSQTLPTLESNAQSVTEAKTAVDVLSQQTKVAAGAAKVVQSEADGARIQITENLAKVAQLKTESEAAAAKALEARTSAEAYESQAKDGMAEVANLVSELQKRHVQVSGFKTELEALLAKNKELNEKAETLLPHSASAGLASAFREQKKRFKWPQRGWLLAFIATILALFAIAAPDFWNEVVSKSASSIDSNQTWDSILRHAVRRLPLVLPLVWMAIYAGRNYSMSVRVEEDYAYKEAVSTAFEGYRREMNEIRDESGTRSPLYTLCGNVLTAIHQRPGRIYEGEHYDPTPLTPLATTLEKLIKQLGEKLPKSPPSSPSP